MTPLHYACKGGFTECVRLLLSHPKIDPNIQDKNGWSPFYFVYKERCSNFSVIIRELLSHPEVDPNIQDENGNTPLHFSLLEPGLFMSMFLNHSKNTKTLKNRS